MLDFHGNDIYCFHDVNCFLMNTMPRSDRCGVFYA